MNTISKMLNVCLKFKKDLILLYIFSFLKIFFMIFTPFVNSKIIDKGIGNKNLNALILYFALIMVLHFLCFINYKWLNYFQVNFRNKLNQYLQVKTVNYYLDKNYSELDNLSSGEIESNIIRDSYAFTNVAISVLIDGVIDMFSLIIFIGIIIFMRFDIAVLTLLIHAIVIFIKINSNKKIEKISMLNREKYEKLMSVINELASNMRNIPLIGASNYIVEKYKKNSTDFFKSESDCINKTIHYSGLASLIITLLNALIFFLGGIRVINNNMSLGQLISFVQYSNNTMSPLTSLLEMSTTISRNKKEISNMLLIVESSDNKTNQTNKINKINKINKFEITIKDLSFSYDNTKIFSNAKIKFKLGKLNYITGKSGIGKTTLFKILTKCYEHNNSDILIGNHNICKITREDLLDMIGVVTQDVVIFKDTILNNLTLYNSYDIELVKQVCDDCAILDMILNTENKFETMISDSGFNISGGQKQRLALARMILQDKKIILIDEAMSGVDQTNEIKLKDTLKKYCTKKLILIITHNVISSNKNYNVFEIKNRKIYKL